MLIKLMIITMTIMIITTIIIMMNIFFHRATEQRAQTAEERAALAKME